MSILFRSFAIAGALLALGGFARDASAQLLNGGFETFAATGGDRGVPTGGLSNWTIGFTSGSNVGYPAIITSTLANGSGFTANGTGIALSNPSNGGSTTITASPATGNFLAWENPNNACNCYLYQSIGGLTVGTTYMLSFYEAGAVWTGSTVATSDNWKVGWGTTAATSVASQTTSATVNTPIKGFSGWLQQQWTVTATATSMVLSFMANHPSGVAQPPFALLDGVSLTAVSTPEPASAILVASGMLGLAGLRRMARRRG